MEKINVFALGGLDECGKNMYIIEVGDDIYVVEAGSKYPDKTSPGVDVIIPNYDYLLEKQRPHSWSFHFSWSFRSIRRFSVYL